MLGLVMRSIMLLLVFCCIFSILMFIHGNASGNVEIDSCAQIYRVVDGDTFDAFPVGRVRLADINAPEIDTPEGKAAREALVDLFEKYGPRIYLDVDDVNVMDKYNRIVAVSYLRYNSTHLLNVNEWLLENGHAAVSDYDNEFNPGRWPLYLYHPGDPCRMVETRVLTTTATRIITLTATLSETFTQTLTQTVTLTTTVTIERAKDVPLRELFIAAVTLLVLALVILVAVARSRRR